VTIRSGAPGTGKTYELFEEWINYSPNCRHLYLSHSHEFLEEQYKRLYKRISVRHLEGLRRLCPCLAKDENGFPINSTIAKLIDLQIPYDHICAVCKNINAYPQKQCPYQRQFDNIKSVSIVLAPVEYAFTTLLDKKYKPNYIAVDDCLDRKRIHPTRKDLEELLYMLTTSSPLIKEPIQSFQELLSMDYESILQKLNRAYETNLKVFINEAKDSPNEAKRDFLYTTSPNELMTYCKQAIHGLRDRFATPALFRLFDYVFKNKKEDSEVQLKIIEAIPNYKFLKLLAKRYQKEENVTVVFYSDGFNPNLVDRGSVVYHMGNKNAWYPYESIKLKETRKHIRGKIEWILEYFFNNNRNLKIGVILKKPKGETEAERQYKLRCTLQFFIPEEYKNVEVETFGNLRGKNSLENCDVLFIIGTYVVNKEEMAQEFSDWFARDPSTMELREKGKHGGYYHYVDLEVEILRRMKENYEMYQAYHRIRPVRSKKLIFAFAYVPKKKIENDRIRVVRITRNFEENKNRSEWLIEFVRLRGEVSVVTADFILVRNGLTEKF
jgi:hypothetical protein